MTRTLLNELIDRTNNLNAQISFTREEWLLPDDQWQALLDATIWCLRSGVNSRRRELQAEEKK